MNEPFISIIIPVYNCSKYISRLLDSILCQQYSNYEVIVVDDGSTDDLDVVLKKYNNPKIKIFHKMNGGVSDARNFGIRKSTGKYLLFADADDFYERNLFSEIVPYLDDNNYDFLYFNFYNTINEKNKAEELKTIDCYSKELSVNEGIDKYLNGEFSILLKRFPCNKIYRRQIIIDNNINFPIRQKLAEDMIFNMEYLNNSKNMYYINKSLYNYCFQSDSVTRKYFNNFNDEILFQIKNINALLEKYNIQHREHLLAVFYISNITLLFFNEKMNHNILDRNKKIYDFFNNKDAKKIISRIKITKLSFKELGAYIIIKLRLYYLYLMIK